jgi:2-aminoethylphosphonate-pyruvate transaminase
MSAADPRDPWLLTPGPLTTSATVKAAMLHDWGSRDASFIRINREVRERLVAMAGAAGSHVCVPIQGSGTFAVEAMIGTIVPRDGKLLVLVNGAYGRRIVKICEIIGRAHVVIERAENQPIEASSVTAALVQDPSITHVAVIHCETTSGILNPLEEIAAAVAHAGRSLLVDAMSAFGAVAVDAAKVPFDALAASSNKCIEGVPGVGFVIVRQSVLEAARGNAHSLSLDLQDQWVAMEGNGQWRFTPPTHVLAAFHRALEEHAAEGGVAGRGKRYRDNCRILIDGMRAFGFETLLPDAVQAPIIVTFHMPADPKFHFQTFYDRLKDRGFVIYPGKLTVADSFRIGCIGRLGADVMNAALVAIRDVMKEMGVESGAPATQSRVA